VHIVVFASSKKYCLLLSLAALLPFKMCPVVPRPHLGAAHTPFGSHYAGFELVMDKKCASNGH